MNDISIPSTGIPLIDTIGKAFILAYIALTILARILPPTSKAGHIASALSLDLRKLLSPPPAPPPASSVRKAAAAALCFLGCAGCAGWQTKVNTALTDVESACVAVQAAGGVLDPPAIVAACSIDVALTPVVERIINSFQAQEAARAAR